MLGLSAPDASVVVAAITATASIVTASITVGVIGRRVRKINRELEPNGGQSIKDVVDRLDKRTSALESAVVGHNSELAVVNETVTRTEAGIDLLLQRAGLK